MKPIILILALLLSFMSPAYAAFPMKQETPAAVTTVNQQHQNKNHFAKLKNKLYGSPVTAVPEVEEPAGLPIEGIWGILSLTMAFSAIIVYAVGIASVSALAFFLVGGLLSIGAIITGAIGFNKPLNGLAISGFVLGILGLIPLALLALLIAIMGPQ